MPRLSSSRQIMKAGNREPLCQSGRPRCPPPPGATGCPPARWRPWPVPGVPPARTGTGQKYLFDELTLPVQITEGLGQSGPLLTVLGQQQLGRHLGTAHPSCGIDSGAREKPMEVEVISLPSMPHSRISICSPGRWVSARAEGPGDNGPVFIGETHHIRHRTDGRQVGVFRQHLGAVLRGVKANTSFRATPTPASCLKG